MALCGALVVPILVFGLFWSELWAWAQDVAGTFAVTMVGK